MEAVGQLTGGIAHDFNNLLTGVIGSLDLMQKRIAQGRIADVERYVDAGHDVGKPRGGADPPPARLRAPPAARSQAGQRQPAGARRWRNCCAGPSARRSRWRSSRPAACGGTFCDPHQLESALLNLVINARDAMPDGGRLTIETANAHLDDAYAAELRDVDARPVCLPLRSPTPALACRRLCRRAPSTRSSPPSRSGRGPGLGLSMIYGFARQSDGHVRIYSEVGQGTTVKLYLPRYRGAVEEAAAASAADATCRRRRPARPFW